MIYYQQKKKKKEKKKRVQKKFCKRHQDFSEKEKTKKQ